MNVKFTLALLLGIVLIFASPARATSTRSGSGYGTTNMLTSPSTLVTQWGVCIPETTNCDLLLQINSPTTPTESLLVTLNNTLDSASTGYLDGEDGNPSLTFGAIDCSMNTGNLGNSNSPCASTANNGQSCGITEETSSTFEILGSCVAMQTFYFDLQNITVSLDGIPDVNAADVSQVTPAPEPGSVALLAIGLIPLALLPRRRARA